MALEEFKKAVSQDDKNPYFYKGLGTRLRASSGSAKDAIEAFRKAAASSTPTTSTCATTSARRSSCPGSATRARRSS